MPLILNLDDSQFFIAIGKSKAHSFVMLGTYQDNQVQHLLCRVGKGFHLENKALCSVLAALSHSVYSTTAAKCFDEGISRKKLGHHPISYQAYDLSFAQYLEFVRILEAIQEEENKFFCYKLIERQSNWVVLEATSELIGDEKRSLSPDLFSALHRLSLENTCRHGAIKLIEETLQQPVSPMVSRSFFSELACRTFMDFGVPSPDLPFYVLPPPPNSYQKLGAEKMLLLQGLYTRMQEMLLLDANSQATQEKFLCLKNFYQQQLIDEIKEPSLERLLFSIQQWKNEHSTLLNKLRKTYFWDEFMTRKSKTFTMIETLEQELKKSAPAP